MSGNSAVQFLYSTSRQFPHDEVCEQIVRALHARNWKAPGFTVTIGDYGSGAQKLRYVSQISSDACDVRMHFCRPQGELPGGRFNDIAAIDYVQIPRRRLHVYQDESGPTYCVYVGDDWERDRAIVWDGYNAKLHGRPRTCLRYSGDRRYQGVRATRLVGVDDYREHAPEGDDPRSYGTAEVIAVFRDYLRDVVLPAVEAHPVADAIDDVCAELPPIPFPPGVGPFFTRAEPRDAIRIATGKDRSGDLPLADRYGLAPSLRLAPLGVRGGEDLPEVAYDGFVWCAPSSTVPEYHVSFYADQLVKVTPRDARGVYVADHGAYEKCRAEVGRQIEGQRNSFTDEEVSSFVRARACTIVPITEYAGNYEDPVYLINRELGFDEVEVIGRRAP